MWAPIVPSREIMAYVADHFPEPMLGYLRVFFKQEPDPELIQNARRLDNAGDPEGREGDGQDRLTRDKAGYEGS